MVRTPPGSTILVVCWARGRPRWRRGTVSRRGRCYRKVNNPFSNHRELRTHSMQGLIKRWVKFSFVDEMNWYSTHMQENMQGRLELENSGRSSKRG